MEENSDILLAAIYSLLFETLFLKLTSSMEQQYGVYLFLLAIGLFLYSKFRAANNPRPRLPPGPWQLPVIGSLHHLLRLRGQTPHRTLRDLSQQYGPLMLLRICERMFVVVSSAEAARDMFKGNDVAFEQRPRSPGIDSMMEDGLGLFFAPYGERWRLLRRIIMTELLSPRRVESLRSVREAEAGRLISSLASLPPGHDLVNIDERIDKFVADVSARSIFGGDDLTEQDGFQRALKKGLDFSTFFGIRDLFPSWRLLGRMLPRRNEKAVECRRELYRLMDSLMQRHEKGDSSDQGIIGVLRRIYKEGDMRNSLTPGDMRAVMLDVFSGALDTSSSTLQFAMAELIMNPRVMEKVQLEVRSVIAGGKRLNEVSLREMHYLKAVVKEAFRLHPPAPFNPRECRDDRKIQGYDIPQGTIALVNVWAISRDPKYWEEPERFVPERFDSENAIDFKGLDFEFLPFGAGRRICPGISFSQANIEIALGSLLYHFDWELPEGIKPWEVDMTDVFGLTLRKKSELLLRPIPVIPLLQE